MFILFFDMFKSISNCKKVQSLYNNTVELESLLKSFYLVSDMSMTIFDSNGNIIISYPKRKSPFCTLVENKSSNKCRACDIKAMETCNKTGKMYIYKCWCGLYEAIVPLYTYGQLSGYFMMGQILDVDSDINEILKSSNLDSNKAYKALLSTCRQSYKQIEAFGQIVDICAKYLTLVNGVDTNASNIAFKIQQYLLNHYKEDISIDVLVNTFNMSRGSLFNYFKKEFNTSIHQRLLSIRLNEARKLLTSTSYSIKQISLEVGFKDPDYFSKAFKKIYGISPRKAREENI